MPTKKKLFIHIPKNAGTSLLQHRSRFESAGKTKVTYNRSQVDHDLRKKFGLRVSDGHARWLDVKPPLREHGCFCLIRNPWDREVSKYKFLLQGANDPKSKNHHNRSSLVHKYSVDGKFEFEHYLEIRHEFYNKPYLWLHACESFYPQTEYIVNEQREIQADVLRFENLVDDIKRYIKVDLNKTIHVNKTERKSHKHYYNDKTIQIVADLYKEDIENFGYDFDTGPTKGYFYQ